MTSRGPAMAPSPASNSISLEHWSTQLAPLTDKQKASVSALASLLQPASSTSVGNGQSAIAGQDEQGGRYGDALTSAEAGPSDPARSHATTQSNGTAAQPSSLEAFLPTAPLNDAPSYLSWLSQSQQHLLKSAQANDTSGLDDLTRAADEAQVLLDHLEAARVHIAELRAGAQSVEEGSEDLRDEAESMVERIDHLSKLTEALSLRLSYFAILPASTSFLSSPSLSLVTSSEFLLTLERLDVALAFVRAHAHYRDAALYKMRFEHCVVRAGTLIRMYVMSRFNSLATELGVRPKEWDRGRSTKGKEREFDADNDPMMNLADPAVGSLVYVAFEEEAGHLQQLIYELERRASLQAPQAATGLDAKVQDTVGDTSTIKDTEPTEQTERVASARNGHDVFQAPEFATLLEECRSAYFEARQSLLVGIVQNCIARIEVMTQNDTRAGTHENPTIRFIERAMTFFAAVGRAELKVYAAFFDEQRSQQSFGAFLKAFSAPLDDRLRPRLAREATTASISTICVALIDSFDMEDATTAMIAPFIASTTLNDAQSKLAASARSSIQGKQIARFDPTEGDLAYPAKLKRGHKRAPSIGGAGLLEAAAEAQTSAGKDRSERADTHSTTGASVRLFAIPTKTVVTTWYAPLLTTLQILAYTSPALPAKTFNGIAADAIEACRINLLAAGQKMASEGGFGAGRIGAASRMDVPLFLLRHLLILREMAASVDLRVSSSATFAVDRQAAGISSLAGGASAGRLDFGRLVDTLNSLWSGLRGSTANTAPTKALLPTTSSPQLGIRESLETARTGPQTRLEQDVMKVREQFIDIVAQGVALPLRVYIDQKARQRRDSGSLPTSPIKELTGGLRSPPITSPPPIPRHDSTASILGAVSAPGSASQSSIIKARSALQAFSTCARSNLGEMGEGLRIYLEDARAIRSLVEPVFAKILASYDAFANCVVEAGISSDDLPQLTSREDCEKMLLSHLPASMQPKREAEQA